MYDWKLEKISVDWICLTCVFSLAVWDWMQEDWTALQVCMLKTGNCCTRVIYIFLGLLLVWLEVYSEAFGAQQCNPQQVRVYRGNTSLPLTLHLHTDWLRVRWPLFPNRGRAIRTCTSFRVTCLLWECRPMIGCAGACGCGLPCGCSEGGRKRRRSRRRRGQQSEWLVKCESVCRINFREMRVIPE